MSRGSSWPSGGFDFRPMGMSSYAEAMDEIKEEFDTGVWYQSAVSGLWYRNKNSAGEICAVRVDGVTTYREGEA